MASVADHPAGTGLVLDYEWAPEVLRHPGGHQAGDVIHRAAGRERQNEPDRPRRI
jgi:hypothetical protein